MTTQHLLKDDLVRAKSFIADRSKWVKHVMARDIGDFAVDARDPKAVKFDVIAALHKATDYIDDDRSRFLAAAYALAAHVDSTPRRVKGINLLMEFNDGCKHGDLMALFDKAIEGCDNGATAARAK